MMDKAKVPADQTANTRTVSRRLLVRKAMAAGRKSEKSETLEDSFPAPDVAVADEADERTGNAPATAAVTQLYGPPAPPPAQATQHPAPTPIWSAEDESGFQALAARRKAAGYQRRGKDVSAQRIRVGQITPNPNTVVSVIVGIVADAGNMDRASLVEAMAAVTFPHPRAQPQDKGWCQGYIAGAVRQGFLEIDDDGAAAKAETN